jgi:hypothetical protein
VFALLQANWPVVRRVVNALCRRDRITTAELDALIAAGRPKGGGPVVEASALDCP